VAPDCRLASNREVKGIKNEFRIFGRDPHLDVGLTPAVLKGAATVSKTTLGQMTLSITIKIRHNKIAYAVCLLSKSIILSAVMLSVAMKSSKLSVIILSVDRLNVMAPF